MSILIKDMDEIPEDGAVLVVKHDNGKAYIKHDYMYGYSMELVKLPAIQDVNMDEPTIKNTPNPTSLGPEGWKLDYSLITRCKDCKYYEKYVDGIEKYQWDGFCSDWAKNTYEDWYCSRAVRR